MTAEELFKQGVEFVKQEKWDEAIETFTRFIQEYPNDSSCAIAYNNRGRAYRGKGDYDRAIEDYNKAIELNPNFTAAYTNRGAAYNNEDEYDLAIEDLNKAIELDPNNAKAYNNRGFAYRGKGDYDRAIENYNKALEIDPDNKNAIHNRAVALALRESNKLGGFREEYEKKAEDYKKKELDFDGQIRRSLNGLVITLAVLALLLVILPIIQFEVSVRPFLVVFSSSIQSEGSLGFLPWVLLIGLVLSPLAWRISYLRDEKRHNELLKHSYERKAHLETRWVAFQNKAKQLDMEEKLMEHWMDKSPEETILAVMGKKDSGSSPLTPAALAAIVAAVRRAN